MTPQQRLDSLLADVWQPTDALVTISDLESVLDDFGFAIVRLTFDASTQPQITDGMSATEVMVAKATAMKMQDAVEAMRSGGGLSLSSPARQAVIDALATAGQWPDAVTTAVKALGGVYVKEWQRQGMAVEPTLESVQAIIDAENLATQIDNLQTRFDAIKNQIGTVEQADAVAALRVIADELEE